MATSSGTITDLGTTATPSGASVPVTSPAATATTSPSASGIITLDAASTGPTSAQLASAASAHNIWNELVFALVGVGVLAVVANMNDRLGRVLEALMIGFALMWFLMHDSTVAGWLSRAIGAGTAPIPG